MSARWIGFLAFIWVILTLFGCFFNQAYLGTDEANYLNNLVYFKLLKWYPTGISQISVPGPNLDYFDTIFKMAIFDYAFIPAGSVFQLFRWIVFMPLSAIVVYGLVYIIAQAIQGRFAT